MSYQLLETGKMDSVKAKYPAIVVNFVQTKLIYIHTYSPKYDSCFYDGYLFYWGCKFYSNEIFKAMYGRDYNKCGMKMHDCRLGLEKVCNLVYIQWDVWRLVVLVPNVYQIVNN
jgi:hypothetical protein